METASIEILVHIASPATFMSDRRYRAIAQNVKEFEKNAVTRTKVADIQVQDAAKSAPGNLSPSVVSTETIASEDQDRLREGACYVADTGPEVPAVIDLTKSVHNRPNDASQPQSSRRPPRTISKPGSRFLLGTSKLPSKNPNPPFKQPLKKAKRARIEAFLEGLQTPPAPRPRTAPETTSTVQVPWSGLRRRAYSDSSPPSTMSIVSDTNFGTTDKLSSKDGQATTSGARSQTNSSQPTGDGVDGGHGLSVGIDSATTTNASANASAEGELSQATIKGVSFQATPKDEPPVLSVLDQSAQELLDNSTALQETSEDEPSNAPVLDPSTQELLDDTTALQDLFGDEHSLVPVLDQSTQELLGDSSLPALSTNRAIHKRPRFHGVAPTNKPSSQVLPDESNELEPLLEISSQPPPTASGQQQLSFSSQSSDLPFRKKRRLHNRLPQPLSSGVSDVPAAPTTGSNVIPTSAQFDLDRALSTTMSTTNDGPIFNCGSLDDWTSSAKPSIPSSSSGSSLASTVPQTPSPQAGDHTNPSFTFDEEQPADETTQRNTSFLSRDAPTTPIISQESWNGFSPTTQSTPYPFSAIHNLPDETNPPSPSRLTAEERRSYITPYLHDYCSPHGIPFNPIKVTRDVSIQERGYWDLKLHITPSQSLAYDLRSSPSTQSDDPAPWAFLTSTQLAENTEFDVTTWSEEEFITFWKEMTKLIGSGKMGRNTRMIRVTVPSHSPDGTTTTTTTSNPLTTSTNPPSTPSPPTLAVLIRVFCPGEILSHVHKSLCVNSSSLCSNARMIWYGVDSKPVVTMWGGYPTGLDIGRWARKIVGKGLLRKVCWGLVERKVYKRMVKLWKREGAVDERRWEFIVD